LIFIHNSLSVPGYIQQFNVVTMLEFMSMQNAPFLIPLVTARGFILLFFVLFYIIVKSYEEN